MSASTPDIDVEEVGARVEDLLDRIAATDHRVAGLAEELVRSLVQLYGAGLGQIVATLQDRAPDTLTELSDDVLVSGLLALHDLQPDDVVVRVEQALDRVRPLLGSHGGDVTFLGIEAGTVHLRLEGTCNGCGSSQETLEHAVEAAVFTAAPETVAIDVEGAVAPDEAADAFIPVEAVLRCPSEVEELRR